MRLVAVILLALQTKFAIASAGEKEHVHFKIYVPEIIKHHIHTKTIFIHIHEPKKKAPKKNSHLESHYDDWSHYSNYNNNADEYDKGNEGERSAITAYDAHQAVRGGHYVQKQRNQGYVTSHEGLGTSPRLPSLTNENSYPHYHRETPESQIPHYDDFQGHYRSRNELDGHPVPVKSLFPNGIVGYSYPPQYDVRENNVENVPENSHESYGDSHEEGHSKRQQSETGHFYTNDLSNFYNDKHEESSEAISTESREIDENNNSESYRYAGDNYITTRMTIR